MSKITGLGWTALDVDDPAGVAQDLRADVNSLEFSTPAAVLEVTGIDKYSMERLQGLLDFSATLNFTGDVAATDSVHSVFDSMLNIRTVLITIAGASLSNEVLFTDYANTRGTDGSYSGTAPCVLASGIVPTWT